MKITFNNLKITLFLIAAVAALNFAAAAQTKKKIAAADKSFFVPCAKALRIGLSAVEKLHSAEMKRVTKGETDSDTELLETQSALKNYLSCRRADTAVKLKKLTAAEQTQIKRNSENARRLARMRIDLIYGVSFDEKFTDPINYTITQKAIALVEDYKSSLVNISRQPPSAKTLDSNSVNGEAPQIAALLTRIEKISREHDEAKEFAIFKTAAAKILEETKSDAARKVVTTAFLIQLLKMNLADEN